MDLSKPIVYRALDVNGVALQPGRVLRGLSVEHVDYSNIETVGYTEKRAGSDGMHASDVYLGARQVEMRGFVYATSVAEMFDFLHILRATFSPTSAYQESPGDRGFLPLHYSQSTLDTDSFPADPTDPPDTPGTVPLYMNLRPLRPVRFAIDSDRQQRSNGSGPSTTPWQSTLFAKDPRVYVDPAQIVPIDGVAKPVPGADLFAINRGDYETPFNVQLVIGAAVPALGTFHLTGLNGIDMTIKIEAKANVIYRWFGDDRVLMTQDISGGVTTNPFILRMDLVTFATKNRRPTVPAAINPPTKPYSTKYQWSCTVALATGSRLFWSEAFA